MWCPLIVVIVGSTGTIAPLHRARRHAPSLLILQSGGCIGQVHVHATQKGVVAGGGRRQAPALPARWWWQEAGPCTACTNLHACGGRPLSHLKHGGWMWLFLGVVYGRRQPPYKGMLEAGPVMMGGPGDNGTGD